MPRKRKANIARIQNLQGGGDTSSFKRQKSTGADSDSNRVLPQNILEELGKRDFFKLPFISQNEQK
jgi:hypothetical protein